MSSCSECSKEISIFGAKHELDGKTVCFECFNNLTNTSCEANAKAIEEREQAKIKARLEVLEEANKILLVTTPSIQGKEIVQYHSMVSAESVIGTGVISETCAAIDDILGITSSAFQGKIAKAKEHAMTNMRCQALAVGANAIVGVQVNYLVTAESNMFMVSIAGTPVTVNGLI